VISEAVVAVVVVWSWLVVIPEPSRVWLSTGSDGKVKQTEGVTDKATYIRLRLQLTPGGWCWIGRQRGCLVLYLELAGSDSQGSFPVV
jgi:hypothetical protein